MFCPHYMWKPVDAPPKRYTRIYTSWVFWGWLGWKSYSKKSGGPHDVLRVNQQVIIGICLFLILIPLLLMTYNTCILYIYTNILIYSYITYLYIFIIQTTLHFWPSEPSLHHFVWHLCFQPGLGGLACGWKKSVGTPRPLELWNQDHDEGHTSWGPYKKMAENQWVTGVISPLEMELFMIFSLTSNW